MASQSKQQQMAPRVRHIRKRRSRRFNARISIVQHLVAAGLCLLLNNVITIDFLPFRSAASSSIFAGAQEFNYEVEKRVIERLSEFLGDPVAVNDIIFNFRKHGGFPHQMEAPDRDLYLKMAYSVSQKLIYYGLEDGSISGYYLSNSYYREPGSSGYPIDDVTRSHHLNSCIDNETGEPRQCKLQPGDDYVSCDGEQPDDGGISGLCPRLALCPKQRDCSNIASSDELTACQTSQKWCRQYSIVQAPEDVDDTQMGYVPFTNHCIDKQGQFSETPNAIIDPSSPDRDSPDVNMVTCTYGDLGQVPVQRGSISGPFGYCSDDSESCENTFLGGYASFEYDPRYRPWYIQVKEYQKSIWSPPYPFFNLGIGVTYASPIYTEDEAGRQVFAGVLAVDYQFENIVQFLVDNYQNTTTSVFIYEDASPHYVIGSSTGSQVARNFLTEDLTQPCPVDRGEEVPCTPVRTKMADLSGDPMDPVLVEAYQKHLAQDYPREVLSVTIDDSANSGVFVSQSAVYEQVGTELKWRVIVVAPGARSKNDAIIRGTDAIIPLCTIAATGFVVCAAFLFALFTKRKQKAIIFADWRFTSAFVFGCALLNLSSFTLLGENTDSMCLVRMWTFHLSFVIALAPLFVKIWRIKQLVGNDNLLRRTKITNLQAALYTTPMILGQVIILAAFTAIDPPVSTKAIENIDGVLTQKTVCESEQTSFFITIVVYEAGFVFSGCILAYLTRDLHDDFGESKQLIFAMYNIALVGIITVVVLRVADLSGNAQSLMQAVGVLWGTGFSTAAFVIPRMIQSRQRRGTSCSRFGTTHVSGFDRSPLDSSTAVNRNLQATYEHRDVEDSISDISSANDAVMSETNVNETNQEIGNGNGNGVPRFGTTHVSGFDRSPLDSSTAVNRNLQATYEHRDVEDSISDISSANDAVMSETNVNETNQEIGNGNGNGVPNGAKPGSGTQTVGLDDVSSGGTSPDQNKHQDANAEILPTKAMLLQPSSSPKRVDW
eukprot:CAMPEP_0119572284 /NCGR_PEP_ID=MMETSP1352-20130426/44544_1 /TAXON_ID=265584 /ORGANISM="Stauroneis constricta, Strain CCMP1120" /LENGTH=998 /DNA_ID=CAMNT_0007621969 /DNA_START=74 /DNA_END=3067 /DNA_ORIENTATION=+